MDYLFSFFSHECLTRERIEVRAIRIDVRGKRIICGHWLHGFLLEFFGTLDALSQLIDFITTNRWVYILMFNRGWLNGSDLRWLGLVETTKYVEGFGFLELLFGGFTITNTWCLGMIVGCLWFVEQLDLLIAGSYLWGTWYVTTVEVNDELEGFRLFDFFVDVLFIWFDEIV